MVYLFRTGSLLAVGATIMVLWLGTAGCDFIQEPDRFIDEDVQLPVVAAVDFSSIRSGQHLAGRVDLTADLDTLSGSIERVVLTVDGQPVDETSQAPFLLSAPTTEFPDGPAALGLVIYRTDGNGGLLGLGGAPSTTLVTPVVFDQRPPTAVENLRGTWAGSDVDLEWTPNTDPNFYAYVVVREDTWSDDPNGGSMFGPQTTGLDTLFDASVGSYEDAGLPTVYGFTSTYRVYASNRAQLTDPAETNTQYGDATDIVAEVYDRLAYSSTSHPSLDIIYSSDGTRLYVQDASHGTTLTSVDLVEHLQDPSLAGTADVVGIRQDRSEVYVFAADPASGIATTELLAFSATDQPAFLRRLSTFPEDAFGLRLGPDGTVVAQTNGEYSVYSTDDGALVTGLTNPPPSPTVHRAGADLLTQHVDGAADSCVLRRYNPASGDIIGEVTYPFDGMSCWNVYPTASGDSAYLISVMESRFRTITGTSLTLSTVTEFPVPQGDLVDRVVVDAGRLFLGVSSHARYGRSGRLLEVDATAQMVVREWDFATPIDRLILSADRSEIFALTADRPLGWLWRIPLAN
ncbi:MAG: hypothetical protein GVY25_16370 [Bacteroidetes bacterium]|jgi:hypothetical protein|nr:hypothetical protein [Bacteroidota bacterium]